MNGKIRVSIVATSLQGSKILTEPKPVLNVVNGSSVRNNTFNENLFSKSNVEQQVFNSIDGATALKLDESFEIKNNEEQEALINNFERNEENKIAEGTETTESKINMSDQIPNNVSIENTTYMENNSGIDFENQTLEDVKSDESMNDEYTPKLFSEDHLQENIESKDQVNRIETEQLFDQETGEDEDFEIPAFLRRQKF